MNSSNKHLERVIAALVVVIIALIMVVMKLGIGDKHNQSAVSQIIPPQVHPPTHTGLKPATEAFAVPVAEPPAPALSLSLLSTSGVAGMTPSQLRLARNEIYARHGYRFHTPSLLTFFQSKAWYHPDTANMQAVEKRFSSAETAKIALLTQKERADVSQKAVTSDLPIAAQPSHDNTPPPADEVSQPAITADAGTASAPPVAESVQVWVNTNTGVYHYPGERWYGNTKEGEYMSEDTAKAAGYRATGNGQ